MRTNPLPVSDKSQADMDQFLSQNDPFASLKGSVLPPIQHATDLGRQLKQLRRYNYLSQRQLADKSGLTQATISHLELGRTNPTLATLEALATSLKADLTVELKPKTLEQLLADAPK